MYIIIFILTVLIYLIGIIKAFEVSSNRIIKFICMGIIPIFTPLILNKVIKAQETIENNIPIYILIILYIITLILFIINFSLLLKEKNNLKNEYVLNNDTDDTEEKKSYVLLCICSFLFPIIGLLAYIINIGSNYTVAKKAGRCAIAGFLLGLFFTILFVLSFFSMFFI